MSLPADNDVKERLSLAFVRAVAARCGCYVTATEGADLASIDATLHSARQPKRMISLQLKATTAPVPKNGDLLFDLPVKNYNDLREKAPTAPQALVVFHLPKVPAQWLKCTDAGLVMKKAAWWVDLWGAPGRANTTSVRVTLPRSRLFDVAGLEQILAAADKIAHGAERRPMHEL